MATAVVDLVLAVFKDPGMIAEVRERPLPEDLAQVLRMAAREGAAVRLAQEMTGADTETLVEASVFFLQQILFAPQADSYRVLGATSDASSERLRENYRWLMKWLHPDRNADGWEAVYADRVNVAWQDLKTAERRAEYDRRQHFPVVAPVPLGVPRRRAPAPSARVPLLSGSTVRRLPAIVLGSAAGLAALLVGALYWAHRTTEQELASRGDGHAPASTASVAASPESSAPVADPGVLSPPAWDEAGRPLEGAGERAASAAGELPAAAASGDQPPALAAEPSAPATADIPAAGVMEVHSAQVARTEPGSVSGSVLPAANDVSALASTTPVETSVAGLNSPPPAAANPGLAGAGPGAVESYRESRTAGEPNSAHSGSAHATNARAVVAPLPTAPANRPGQVPVATIASEPPAEAITAPAFGSPGSSGDGRPREPLAVTNPRTAESGIPASAVNSPADAGSAEPVPDLASSPTPAAARLSATAAPEPATPLAQAEAEALVREFTAAYNAGDGRRFERLFGRSGGHGASFDSMRRRFDSTEMRFLEISQVRWQRTADHARATARYRDTYVPRGSRKAITEAGTIQWELRLDAGDVSISMLERDAQR